MAYKTFAAINVGSDEVSMKIYEVARKTGIRELDFVRNYIELGSDTFMKGYIGHDLAGELCDVLAEFSLKMQEYQVASYLAYGSSALREASNRDLIIDQIKVRTGIEVKTIDTAQQHFLLLKSMAAGMENFDKLIQEGVAILDMGAGNMQVTVYEEGMLIFTQNLRLGTLRIREIMADIDEVSTNSTNIMDEYISNDIDGLIRLFFSKHKVRHIISVGDEMESILQIIGNNNKKDFMKKTKYDAICDKVLESTTEDLSRTYSIPYELATLLKPAVVVYKRIMDAAGAEKIWQAGYDLCDGIAVDYGERQEKIPPKHYFEGDIISYARSVAAKYESSMEHLSNVEHLALNIFDGMRKSVGLNKRERMLLQLACILHECGKYVNMRSGTDYSCVIVMATDFIGLSENEKSIIADVIKYNSWDDVPLNSELTAPLDRKDYIKMLKLTAILRIANGMDRSRRQKISSVKVDFKGREMIVRADTIYDITLEQNTMEVNGGFFEKIYGFKPVLRQKRR